MEYVIDFSELNRINDEFFGINTEKEEIVEYAEKEPANYDPYKDKVNLCMNFENKVIDSLSNIYKDNELNEAENAVKSFMTDFINAKAFEDQTVDDLTEYFDFVSSLFSKLNNDEIKYVIDLVKNADYSELQDVIDKFSKEEDKND